MQVKYDKEMTKLNKKFGDNWGKLVESLVEGDLVRKLQERGIKIEHTLQRYKKEIDGKIVAEYDIVVENGREIVVVEVKTTLNSEDVYEFIPKLEQFRNYFPRYKDAIVYGAVAFINSDSSVITFAERQKLFAIKAINSSISILNDADFVPRAF